MNEEKIECWETLCLNNSACDAIEYNNEIPYCLECLEDCPNRIVNIF
jgi:hypothetical protein